MTKKASIAHLSLCALFAWHLRSEDNGFPPINIFYKVMTGGRSGVPGHRILCPEMDINLRKTQFAFNTLDIAEQIVVVTKHMPCPLNEDSAPKYKKWGDREKADYLNESLGAFKGIYKRSCRKIGRHL